MINKNSFFGVKRIKKVFKKAFTLIELVVVIAVIAILAGVSVAAYFGVTESAKDSKIGQEVKQAENVFTAWRLLEYEGKGYTYASLEYNYNAIARDYLLNLAKYTYDQGLNSYLNFALFDSEENPIEGTTSSLENDPSFSKAVYLISTEDRFVYFEIPFVSLNGETYKFQPELDFSKLNFDEYTIYKSIEDVNIALFNENNSNYWFFSINEIPTFEKDGSVKEYTISVNGKTYHVLEGKKFTIPKANTQFVEDESGEFSQQEFEYYYTKDDKGNELNKYYEGDVITINGNLDLTRKYNEEGISKIGVKATSNGVNYNFSSFEDALEYIENKSEDFTLSTQSSSPIVIDKDLTIPSNLTLIISASTSNEQLNTWKNKAEGIDSQLSLEDKSYDEPIYVYKADGEYDEPSEFSSFTIESGFTLTLEGNAKIVVNGINTEKGLLDYGHLVNNGTIILNDNSTLDCYGLLDGNGKIYANDTSTINEKMDVEDWPGLMKYVNVVFGGESGDDSVDFSHISQLPFPFVNYRFERIQNEISFGSESTYKAVAAVNLADALELAGGKIFSEVEIPVIGPNDSEETFMFVPTEENTLDYPITKDNDGVKTVVNINGKIKDDNAQVRIEVLESLLGGEAALPSNIFQLSLTDFVINVNEDGLFEINNKYGFMPGSGININGGNLVANDKSVLSFFPKSFFEEGAGKDFTIKDYYLEGEYDDAALNVKSGHIVINTTLVAGKLILPINDVTEFNNYCTLNANFMSPQNTMHFYLADTLNGTIIHDTGTIVLVGNNGEISLDDLMAALS